MTLPLGTHLALTDADVERVRAKANADDLVEFLEAEIVGASRDAWSVDTDKAWEGIHRAFAGSWDYDFASPLHGVILGGTPLNADDEDAVSLKTAEQVRAIDMALHSVHEQAFRSAYDRIDQSAYAQPLSDDDFAYCWDNLVDLKSFYARAAEAGRAVLFTAY